MGHRAYVDVIENSKTTVLYAHWGANDLTVVDRLWTAYHIRRERKFKSSLSKILSGLDYDGEYNPLNKLSELVFNECDAEEQEYSRQSFEELGDIEMKIILDLDSKKITYIYEPEQYGPEYPPFEISVTEALRIRSEVQTEAEKRKVESFWDTADEFRRRIRNEKQYKVVV